MELGPNQLKWVEALESGDYIQGDMSLLKDSNDKYCCLGVAEEIFGQTCVLRGDCYSFGPEMDTAYSTQLAINNLKMNNAGMMKAASLNDCENFTFKEIAKYIRDNPELFFTESA